MKVLRHALEPFTSQSAFDGYDISSIPAGGQLDCAFNN